jgi:CBS domain containing-hemolysin-like protein
MDSVYFSLLKIFIAVFLILMNGFFVVSEFAIVKIRRTRLEEMARHGSAKAKIALKVTSALDSYLSATQLGITLSSLALGWIGEPAVASLLNPLVQEIVPNNPILLHTISFAVSFTLITLLHVVVGELIPKSLAIQKTETMVNFIIYPLYVFAKVFYPVIYIFDHLALLGLKVLGVKPAKESEIAHSEEELKLIVSASQQGGIIDQTESEIIKNAVSFSDKVAREVMIPRNDMLCLYLEDSFADNIKVITESQHTRYPVCSEDRDNIIGMVHLRDILMDLCSEKPVRDLRKMLREIIMVPENLSVSEVLQRMKKRRIHIAAVVDEYGGTAGLVTLEDVLEEIVGDILDEHDDATESDFKNIEPNVFEVDGAFQMEKLAELLDIEFEEHEEDTVGGYVFSHLARKPEIGDVVETAVCRFEVLKVKRMRVERVKVTLNVPDENKKSD